MHARDVVQEMFRQIIKQAQMAGETAPQIDPIAVEAAIAQQAADTTEQLAPLLVPSDTQDPLIGIRQKELENDTMEIQRKIQSDAMDFQVDQAKLMQAYELAQQRINTQSQIAEDRNDVNIYRINTQAALKRGAK